MSKEIKGSQMIHSVLLRTKEPKRGKEDGSSKSIVRGLEKRNVKRNLISSMWNATSRKQKSKAERVSKGKQRVPLGMLRNDNNASCSKRTTKLKFSKTTALETENFESHIKNSNLDKTNKISGILSNSPTENPEDKDSVTTQKESGLSGYDAEVEDTSSEIDALTLEVPHAVSSLPTATPKRKRKHKKKTVMRQGRVGPKKRRLMKGNGAKRLSKVQRVLKALEEQRKEKKRRISERKKVQFSETIAIRYFDFEEVTGAYESEAMGSLFDSMNESAPVLDQFHFEDDSTLSFNDAYCDSPRSPKELLQEEATTFLKSMQQRISKIVNVHTPGNDNEIEQKAFTREPSKNENPQSERQLNSQSRGNDDQVEVCSIVSQSKNSQIELYSGINVRTGPDRDYTAAYMEKCSPSETLSHNATPDENTLLETSSENSIPVRGSLATFNSDNIQQQQVVTNISKQGHSAELITPWIENLEKITPIKHRTIAQQIQEKAVIPNSPADHKLNDEEESNEKFEPELHYSLTESLPGKTETPKTPPSKICERKVTCTKYCQSFPSISFSDSEKKYQHKEGFGPKIKGLDRRKILSENEKCSLQRCTIKSKKLSKTDSVDEHINKQRVIGRVCSLQHIRV